MNRKEIAIVVALFLALLGWMMLQRPPPGAGRVPQAEGAQPAVTSGVPAAAAAERPAPELTAAAEPAAEEEPAAAAVEPVPQPEERLAPERIVTITNGVAAFSVTSWGGAVAAAEMREYRRTVDPESGPVLLDFTDAPAFALSGIPGLGANADFEVAFADGGRAALVSRATAGGLRFERRIALEEGYRLRITDTFRNEGGTPLRLPAHGLDLGAMTLTESRAQTRGMAYLGADTLAEHGGKGVKYWGKELPAMLGQRRSAFSCAAPDMSEVLPSAVRRSDEPIAWAAVKNKFFVQIAAPEEPAAGCEVAARRNMAVARRLEVGSVSARLLFAEKTLEAGESVSRTSDCYLGPKKYDLLRALGNHRDDVMEFGFFRVICKPLLWTLNAIYRLIPNYGVAIILLTALVRVLFWPITHKSTESMKRMQELQPQVSALRARFKDKPQKMNQEVMALYRAHKVNPMSGCLPVLVQIPVFIALFTVLRSAVELRFAPFLWIKDLSEPEGLLEGMIPIVGALNILPLFMTATTVWQQHLTPTGGDPQQQKMMMMMPVVMLFVFYSMPSALVLYWSTSQCLAIAQLLIQRRRRAMAAARAKG